MQQKVEILVEYQNEKFRKESPWDHRDWVVSFVVFEEEELEISGPDLDFSEGRNYRLFGQWSEYRGVRQFKYQGGIPERPITKRAIVNYLIKHGKGCGIGPAKAEKIFNLYGEDAVAMARTNPGSIETLCNVKPKQAQVLAERLIENEATETLSIELHDILDKRGFRKTLVPQLIRKFGMNALEIIKRNPFAMLHRFSGCGFTLCDRMWIDLKLPPDRLKRQTLCAWHAVSPAGEGNGSVWYREPDVLNVIRGHIAGAEVRAEEAIRIGVRLGNMESNGAGSLARLETRNGLITPGGEHRYIGRAVDDRNERELADRAAMALNEAPRSLSVAGIPDVTDHQRAGLFASLEGNLGVLSGLPGTGKTFTTGRLIQRCVERLGAHEVILGTPTGKAATRLTQSLRESGVDCLTARTWHSVLKPIEVNDTGWTFEHNEDNPVNASLMIADETSMMDASLMLAVLRARPRGCRLLLVGDPNQLPPVGVGRPFVDFIRAGVPRGHLTEIQRNTGAIVQACHDIQAGKLWQTGDNLLHADVENDESTYEAIKAIIHHESSQNGLDPVWDVQVISPMNDKGNVSCKPINEALTLFQNDSPKAPGSWPWRFDDKIICSRNQFLPGLNDKGKPIDKVYVANGDQGNVCGITEKEANVFLPTTGETVKVTPFGAADWKLAYCITVHRSQGSDWPVAIFIADKGSVRLLDRSLVYTALSRGKTRTYIVGPRYPLDNGCKHQSTDNRRTFLKERIHLACTADLVANL